jgi:predicted GIY-YIG superfamily endonuclease
MTKTKKEVHDYIIKYIKDNGGEFTKWYVGIAEDVKDRLFTQHKVDEKNSLWVYSKADSADDARAVEKSIIDNYKTKGDTGGGSDKTKYVYAYKITNDTEE